MFSKSIVLRTLSVIVLAVTLVGCTSPTVPTAAPTAIQPTVPQQPTVNVQPTLAAAQTQAVQTALADLTKNAPTITKTPVPPTATQAPTNTAVPPTAKPTATYIPWTPAPTATSTTYNCTVVEASPSTTDIIKVGADFDARWLVKNTGSEVWPAATVDIVYVSGTKFDRQKNIDLKADVDHDASLTIVVDMIAPKEPETYTAVWAITRGTQTICTLNLKIVVTK
jgi:hypothetical protein